VYVVAGHKGHPDAVKKTTVRERAKTPAILDNAAQARPGVTGVASWSAPSS
jgi:hypothetical protein